MQPAMRRVGVHARVPHCGYRYCRCANRPLETPQPVQRQVRITKQRTRYESNQIRFTRDAYRIREAGYALGAPVLLHPRIPDMTVRNAYYSGFTPAVDAAFATAGLGWHYDAGIQFIRLVLAGTFDRLPDLQIILGHWGELVLF